MKVGDPARYPELVGAVEALAACGAVSPMVAAAVRQELDTAFGQGTPPGSASSPGPAAHSRLQAVVSPVAAFDELDGVGVILVAVELWTDTVIIRLADGGEGDPERPAGPAQSSSVWWRTTAAVGAAGEALDRPPGPRLLHILVTLSDDIGTTYALAGAEASGEPPWRAEYRFSPGAPPAATRMAVSLKLPAQERRATKELRLPRHRLHADSVSSRPFLAAQEPSRTIRAPATSDCSLPNADSRGRYFIPQSGAATSSPTPL